jgi:hypothetical protein
MRRSIVHHQRRSAGFVSVCLLSVVCSQAAWAATIEHVIHISVDGLRPDAITSQSSALLPNFYRMRTEGAFTDNARDDYDYTVTLPNHVTQLTGRGVTGATGHGWTSNSDPAVGQTLASNKGSYVAGVCDVVHDNGLRTGIYASKTKFSLFDTSWNSTNGALDTTGVDNGRDKVDVYSYNSDTLALTNQLISAMASNPFDYAFIHWTDPDTVGHSSGWGTTTPSTAFKNVVQTMDSRLGLLFQMVDTNPLLAGNTAIILTADHGGYGTDHSNATLVQDYTIPFYVWGPGVQAGADLYNLNGGLRLNPGTGRPNYAAAIQPIRNGEAANLALDLLGLGAVPGSTLDAAQNLIVPEPATLVLLVLGGAAAIRRRGGC